MSTKPRTRPEWLAAALLCALLPGCPQLASDEFDKAEEPHNAAIDSGGSGGRGGTGGSDATGGSGGTGSTGGMSGTTMRIDLSTASSASVGGSSTTNTSQSGGTVDASSVGGSGGNGGNGGSGGNGDTNSDTSSSTGAPPECMEAEVCDGLDNDCDGEIDPPDTCEDGCRGFALEGLEGHGYMFCGTLMGTSEATVVCSEHGLALVQIDSDDENNALVDAVKPLFDELAETSKEQPAFWIGASDDDTEGDWIWVGSGDGFWTGEGDGEPVGDAFENWDEEKPNSANTIPENCAVVYLTDEGPDGAPPDGAHGTWNDLPCDDPYTFVCETE